MLDETQFPLTINDYVFIKYIGHGGSASCYLVESLKFQLNKVFVAKVIPFTQSSSITAENTALVGLNHPNIIKLYDRFTFSSYYVLILEYCENKSLAEAITPEIGIFGRQNQQDTINLDAFKDCAYQIISALSFCHMKKCAHRDIKPSNVLIDHYGRMKLADFGLSIKYQNNDIFDYEYEYEEDENDHISKNNAPLKNDSSISKIKIPLMTPLSNDKYNDSQETFETKIYYFNNVPFKRRKRSSDSDQIKTTVNNLDIPSSPKISNIQPKVKILINDTTALNNEKDSNHIKSHTRKIRKRRKVLCNSFCGSHVYTAPEIILRRTYDPFASDIWSLGVLFIVMLTGRSPWEGKDQGQIQEKILKGEISNDVLNRIPPDFIELIRKMVNINPTDRFTIEEVRSSPFFDDPCIISASHSNKKVKLIQQKSHSYNSNIASFTHSRKPNPSKLSIQTISQNQENTSNLNSFKKLPIFRRPSQIQMHAKQMIRPSASLTPKEQQVKTPPAISASSFKNPVLKTSLPFLNSPQTQVEHTKINEEQENYIQTDQEKEQKQIEQSDSLLFLLQQKSKGERIISHSTEFNVNSQDTKNSISRCQSLFSPAVLNLH